MAYRSHFQKERPAILILSATAVIAGWILFTGGVRLEDVVTRSEAVLRRPTGSPQLVSYEPLPVMEGRAKRHIDVVRNRVKLALSCKLV